ncbi:MAG: hypothetical protein AAGH81_07900, partial [Bacteroidota bacterium]
QEITLENQRIIEQYQNYFKTNRKSVHLHLNKTIFLTGEHIWFSTYIFNTSLNLPSEEKEFVYVDLIKGNGEIITQKTILYTDGSGRGDLLLPNSLSSGLYFLQAYTASMQNFEEDDSSKFPILVNNFSNNDFINYDYVKKSGSPEILVIPEGGHLLDGVFGKCTVRAMDKLGKTLVPDSVLLINGDNKPISKIGFNNYGFGTFSLIPDHTKSYKLILFRNGEILEKELPKPKLEGVTLAFTRNPGKKEIILKVSDKRSDQTKRLERLTLLIHKDKNVIGIPIAPSLTTDQSQFKVNYDALPIGMNTATVVDGKGKVYTERLFYHNYELESKKFGIMKSAQISDSVQLSLNFHYKPNAKDQNLSISILPGDTKSQRFRKKAFFTHHLEAYFPGPEWRYLWTKDLASLEDLSFIDQITIMAKPKYNLRTILNKNLSVPSPNLFTGGIEGTVEAHNKKIKPKNVVLYSKENQLLINAEVIEGRFRFRELILAKGSKLNLSLIGEDGKPHKANFSYVIKPVIANFRHRFKTDYVHKSTEFASEDFTLTSRGTNVQQLDEVTITAKKMKYEKFFQGFFGLKVDSTIAMSTLKEFLLKEGYYQMFIDPLFPDPRRAGTSQIGKINTRCGYVFPSIIFNGVFSDYIDFYQDTRMEYIDEIYWDRPDSCSALLVVFTNEEYKNRPLPDSQITSKEIVVDKGFDSPQPFRRPSYFETDNTEFKHFGVLGWKSIKTKTNSKSLSFKVPVENENEIMVVIEGHSDSGKIISENHLIALNKP